MNYPNILKGLLIWLNWEGIQDRGEMEEEKRDRKAENTVQGGRTS